MLPKDAEIVPLHPSLPIPDDQLLIAKPEDLFTRTETEIIENATTSLVSEWSRGTTLGSAFEWQGIDLVDALAFRISYAMRDVVKSGWVVARALERSKADIVFTDVPPIGGGVPVYPYLSSVGSILASEAPSLKISVRTLPSRRYRRQWHWKSFMGKIYGGLEAPRALAELSNSHPVLAVGPHREFYLPVARRLWRKERSMIVCTSRQRPIRAAHDVGLYLLPLERLATGGDRVQAEAFVREALEAVATIEFRRSAIQLGVDIGPALRVYLQELFRAELPVLAAIGVGFEGCLSRASHLLLVEMGSSMAKACALYARRKSIPVTMMQHGVVPTSMDYVREGVNSVAAWGPRDVEWYVSGLPTEVQVEPTGCPRYDFLAMGGAKYLPEPRLPKGRHVVLFASQSFFQDNAKRSMWDREAILRMVLSASRGPDRMLCIKWHPSEFPSPFPEQGGGLIVQFHMENTMSLVRASSVVLTLFSTVALEAMYLNKPVIFLGSRDSRTPFDPPAAGAGLRVLEAGELREVLDHLLSDAAFREDVLEGQQKYLEKDYTALDGLASERVATLIESTSAVAQ